MTHVVQKEIVQYINEAAAAFGQHEKDVGVDNPQFKTYVGIFHWNSVSTLTVGCESWKSTKGTDRRLKAFEIKCLGEIVGIKWNEFITNTEIRRGVEQDLIS